MSEMKPCPFCGGAAKFQRRKKIDKYLDHYVKCRKCNARTGVITISVLASKDQVDEAERRAIRAWQRRA